MAKTDFLAPPDLRIVGSRLTVAGDPQFSLAAMGTAKMPDGALVYVQSVKAYFQLQRSSAATPDNISVVGALFGAGNWIRMPSDFAGENPWLQQTQWSISATEGDDENLGVNITDAIASFAELRRRLGDDPLITQTYQVYVYSDVDEVLELGARFSGPEAAIWVRGGSGTLLASDTISSWTSLSPTNEPNIQGTSITDFSPYRGAFCRITSGSNIGDSFWLGDTPNSGAAANEQWRHGVIAEYQAGGFSPVSPDRFRVSTADPGAVTFEIRNLYRIKGVVLKSTRIDADSGGLVNMSGFIVEQFYIENELSQTFVSVEHYPVSGSNQQGWGQPIFWKCQFAAGTVVSGTGLTMAGCACSEPSGSKGGLSLSNVGYAYIAGLDVREAVFRDCNVQYLGYGFFDNDAGDSYLQFRSGSRTTGRGAVQVALWSPGDATSAIYVDETSVLHVDEFWGTVGGTVVGWEVDGSVFAGAIADMSSLVVAGNDAEVGGTARTYAQLPYVEPTNNAMIVLNP